MTDILFDTHAEIEKLKAKGFSAEQSEAITDIVRTGVTGGVATKADLAEIKVGLDARIGQLETHMKWIMTVGGGALLLAAPLWLNAMQKLFAG